MLMTEKLQTIINNEPLVYEAGKNYANDKFSNAIIKSTKGIDTLLLDDVSPLPHKANAKVSNKNLFDINSAELTNARIDSTINGVIATAGETYCDFLLAPGDYVLSFNVIDTTTTFSIYVVNGKVSSGYMANIPSNNTSWPISFKNSVDGYVRLKWFKNNNGLKNIQIEKKDSDIKQPTPYTPYISDLTKTKVNVYGKNLIYKYLKGYATVYSQPVVWQNDVNSWSGIIKSDIVKGKEISISSNGNRCNVSYIDTDEPKDGDNAYKIFVSSDPKFTKIKIEENPKHKYIVVQFSFNKEVSESQIQLGSIATPYEPYIPPKIYIPDKDGDIEDIVLNSPNSTVMSDTSGLNIDLNYNADTKKYIDNIFNTPTALSLEV